MGASVAPAAVLTVTRSEMVARAFKFSQQWQDAKSEKSLGQDFWRDFLSIFGIAERRTGIFEYHAQRHSTGRHGWIDFLIPGEFAIEQKSRGENLDDAMQQLADYMVTLPQVLLPHTLVACDFGSFYVRDVVTGQETRFALAELAKNLDPFISLAGYQRQGDSSSRADEVEVNVQATLHLAHIHERLAATKYPTHDTGLLLTRLLYCLFADDTGIWDKALFYDWLVTKTAEDGSDLGGKLTELFAVLDTPKNKRQTNLDADLQEFTYINGGLFRENLRPATFDKESRDDLLAACVYDWSLISPSIFGSLFQNVMNETPDLRRRLGAHYTTRAGIAAVIQPLFLDDLYERFEAAKARAARYRLGALRTLRNELSALTFFDPSCGSGNFLVESYLALRRLETAVLVAIRDEEMKGETGFIQTADASVISNVRTSQFYGIEIEEFPAQVAETAMHIADHIANLELSAAFGHTYARLPLEDNLNIVVGNALRQEWNDLLPASECSYVFGNPPFGGQYQKTEEQTADLRLVWGKGYNGYLDYVTGWYRKAADYIAGGTYAGKPEPRVAFVSTNSICQGEPVAPLWQPLFNEGFSIDFAHRTFRWTSEASGKAGVHCVIVGWSRGQGKPKPTVYERDMRSSVEVDPVVSQARHLNAYLADAPDVFVTPRTTPLSSSLPQVDYGSKIADGGHLLVSAEEYGQVAADPRAAKYLRRFVGAREVMHSLVKWCLWLDDVTPEDLSASPVLRERVEAVRVFRSEPGRDKEVAEAALRPTVFLRDKQPREPYVCIPRHTSHNYTRYALQHFEPNVVTGDHNFRASDPDGFLFALMSSSMFMAWTRGVAGRIRADLRFSKTLVWHNFPVPAVNEAQRTDIITKGKAVLAARAEKPERTLAQMYSPNGMWASLASAHVALDKAVDKAFGCKSSPRSDEARLSVLFEHYLELTEGEIPDKV